MRFILIFIVFSLTSCIAFPVSSPFKITNEIDPDADRTLIAVVTYAKVNTQDRQRQIFEDQVFRIRDSLDKNKGLYGNSIRKELLGLGYWTLTLWEDEASIAAFKFSDLHRAAMAKADKLLTQAKFARFKVQQNELPINWKLALAELEANARTYNYSGTKP